MNLKSRNACSQLAETSESTATIGKTDIAVVKQFISNFLGGSVRGLLYAVGVLWVVPLLVRGLGTTWFGLYAIAATFLRLGYYGAFDLGLSIAITKYAAEARSAHDAEQISRIATAALAFYVTVSALLFLTFGALGQFLISFLSHGAAPVTGLFHNLQLALLAYCLYLMSNTFIGLLAGHPGFHLTHWVGGCTIAAEIAGVTTLYFTGLTLSRVFVLHIAIAGIVLIATYFLARHHYRGLHFTLYGLQWETFKKLSTYAAQMGFASAAVLLSTVYDKLVIGYFSGPAMIAQYEAASRLIDLCRRGPQMIFLPVLPIASELSHRDDERALSKLYMSTFRVLLVITVPMYLVTALAAGPLMVSWLGSDYRMAAFALVMFSLASLVNSCTLPGSQILSGMGRFAPILESVCVGLLCWAILDPLLAYLYGFKGAVTGSALSLSCSSVFFLLRSSKLLLFRPDFAVLRRAIVLGIVGSGVVAMPFFVLFGSRVITLSRGIGIWLGLVFLFCIHFDKTIGYRQIGRFIALVRQAVRSEV